MLLAEGCQRCNALVSMAPVRAIALDHGACIWHTSATSIPRIASGLVMFNLISDSRQRRIATRLWALAVGMSLLTGCGFFQSLRGEGFQDDLAVDGAKLRPRSEQRSGWFLSTKANEIDSHFGN